MNDLLDKDILLRAEKELNIAAPLIEKDWHVIQVLAFLSTLNYPNFEIVFTGGTALSKAHKLIQRFSEDIDFRVIAPLDRQGRKELSAFKNQTVSALRDAGFKINNDAVRARDGNKFFAIDIDYSSHFNQVGGLRPHIQVEVTINSPQLSPVYLPVKSFLTELTQQPPEVERVACIVPVESAADKLSALLWRIPDRVRGDENDDPAIVRHIHDLAILENIATNDLRFRELVHSALKRDNSRPKNNTSFAGLTDKEKFKLLIDILSNDKEYPKEYNQFILGASYAPEGTVPDFITAMLAIKRLVALFV